MMLRLNILLLLLISFSINGNGKSSIYLDVSTEGFSFCYRRLNATDVIGCTSKPSGNVGSVVLILKDETEDTTDKLSKDNAPYVIVLSAKRFADETFMSKLNNNPLINGVVVAQPQSEKERPPNFSDDNKCPNAKHSLYGPKKQCSPTNWNPPGRGYFFMKWNFPIILLHRSERKVLDKIIECTVLHNGKNSTDDRRCAIEIKTPMNAVKDSKVCLRRNVYNEFLIQLAKFCDVMGGDNDYLIARPVVASPSKVILVTARMGSLSLFSGHSFGSKSVAASVGMLVSLAEAFSRFPDNATNSQKQIIFALLDGESMDYSGSTKMAYSISENKFLSSIFSKPIDFSKFETIIELDQLGMLASTKNIYAHMITGSKQSTLNNLWFEEIKKNLKDLTITKKENEVLPPCSTQSFLKYKIDMSTILLADYTTSYENKYYNSMFDNEASIELNGLFNLANALYKALLSMASYPTKDLEKSLDKDKFDEVVSCFFNISACSIREVTSALKRYVKIDNTSVLDMSYKPVGSKSNFQKLADQMLYFRTADKVEDAKSKEDCDKAKKDVYPKWTYRWITYKQNGTTVGVCLRNMFLMQGTNIITQDDAWNPWNTTHFSYWTESRWIPPTVRIFLKPSKRWEAIVVAAGAIITLVSIVCMVFVLKKFNDLFPGTSYLPGTMAT